MNRPNRRNRCKTGLAGLAVAVVVAGSSCSQDAELEADTLCSEYLEADDQTRSEAVRRIGVEIGEAGAGNPLAFGSTDFNCGQNPNQTIADAIRG